MIRIRFGHIIIMGLLVWGAASCKSTKFTDTPVMPPNDNPIVESIEEPPLEVELEPVAEPELMDIEFPPYEMLLLSKAPCYGGGCPHYTFKLMSDGVAYLECHAGCGMSSGTYTTQLGKEVAAQLLQFMLEEEMMNLASFYPTNGRAVDYIPKTTFVLDLYGKSRKRIESYHHSPISLLQLNDWVEEWVDYAQWEAY